MVFPSLPLYLDPPNNRNQPPQAHQQAFIATADDQQQPPPPVSAGPGPSRPGSMAEQARLAKIPQPEAALSCPRCDSNNTKFCYFNNYSLSQPRHFCKTCRRYWTRGGALRNVPVGGGSRRNKRGGKSPSLTSTTPPTLQPPKSSISTTASSAPPSNLALLSASPPPWSQLQEYGYAPHGLEQWRFPHFVGTEAAAAGMYGYREGEWSVGGCFNGQAGGGGGGGWMSNSTADHVLGFGGSSSTANGNL